MIFHRRYLISLGYLFILTIGISVWQSIPFELSPDIQLPSITVSYSWGRTTPEVMEREITRRIEQAASDLKDVIDVSSETTEGQSTVTLKFPKQINIDFKIIELREKLQQLKEFFPPTLSPPFISKQIPKELRDFESFISYSLSGNINQYDLLDFAKKNIQIPLSGVRGIAEIELSGVNEPAIKIEFDLRSIENYGLSVQQIMYSLYDQMKWKSAGFVRQSDKRYSILFPPSIDNIQDFRNYPIQLNSSKRKIKLGDVATISMEDFPVTFIRRVNGNNSLSIQFVKEAGSDALSLSDLIHQKMESIREKLPHGLTLQLEQDSSDKLRDELEGIESQALLSIFLVFLFLLLFIRQFRAPIIILTTILFSSLLAIIGLHLLSFSLNIITLSALTVSFGMVVDNAIIVYEHVGHVLGYSRQKRIEEITAGLKKLIIPIAGSTLTTIGIFIPLVFSLEELRSFLVPLAVTMSITLLSSVLISLTWIPYALIWLIPLKSKEKQIEKQSKKYISSYFNLTRWLLFFFVVRRKVRGYILFILLMTIGIPLFLIPDKVQKPEDVKEEETWTDDLKGYYYNNRKIIDMLLGGLTYQFYSKTHFGEPWKFRESEVLYVNINTPIGTPIEELNKMVRNFEELPKPYNNALTYFETNLSEQNGAYIQYYFKKDYLTRPEPYLLKNDAIYLAARTGNSNIQVYGFGDGYSSGGGSSFSFNATIKGFSYEEVYHIAMALKDKLEKNKRVRNVQITRTGYYSRDNLFHYSYKPNNKILLENQINKYELISLLQTEINPKNTYGQVEFMGRKPYLLAVTNSKNSYQEDFQNRPRKINDNYFDLTSTGELTKEKVMRSISRENQEYTRIVSFDYVGPYQFGSKYLDQIIETYPLPIGNTIQTGYAFFNNDESKYNLLLLMFLSILTVWMIVAALLESWLDPLIILSAIPLAFLGVMMGVMIHAVSFDRGAIAGTLLLIGVCVNNSILLMDGKRQMRLLGISGLRCWVLIYNKKFRSILITTLTTVAGLIPMIISDIGGFWQSMSIVVCWGLSFSTLFLLLLMGIWEKPNKSHINP